MAWKETYTTGSGDKRYRVGWRMPDGRKKSKSFTRSKDADAFMLETERREALGDLYEEAPQTFGEFAGLEWDAARGRVRVLESPETWFGRYRASVRPSSYQRRKDVTRHLADWLSLRIDRLSPALIEDKVMMLATEHPRTAKVLLETIKMILRNAKVRGQRVSQASIDVRPPIRSTEAHRRFLSMQEVEKLADSSGEPFLVRFAALTGLRFGECAALREQDIDLKAGSLTVNNGIWKGELRAPKTKAARRRIKLIPQVREILVKQMLRRPAGTPFVFPKKNGKPWGHDTFHDQVWSKTVTKAGIGHVRFHDLRHTFAALMIASGCHPKTLQALMGHATWHVTMNTYAHLFTGADEAALDTFADMLDRRDDDDARDADQAGGSGGLG